MIFLFLVLLTDQCDLISICRYLYVKWNSVTHTYIALNNAGNVALNKLLKKLKFNAWTPEARIVFEELKQYLCVVFALGLSDYQNILQKIFDFGYMTC